MSNDWKICIGFMADVLYLKKVIEWDEFEDIQNIQSPTELNGILDKIIGGEYDRTYNTKLDRDIREIND